MIVPFFMSLEFHVVREHLQHFLMCYKIVVNDIRFDIKFSQKECNVKKNYGGLV